MESRTPLALRRSLVRIRIDMSNIARGPPLTSDEDDLVDYMESLDPFYAAYMVLNLLVCILLTLFYIYS